MYDERKVPTMKRLTQIELMVVISIIAIQASMLQPPLNQHREKAKGSTCMNNLKQLGYAMTFYAQDNGNNWVPVLEDASNWGGPKWYTLLRRNKLLVDKFINESNSILRCPSESDFTKVDTYCYNYAPKSGMTGMGFSLPIHRLRTPSAIIAIADGSNWWTDVWKVPNGTDGLVTRHANRANALFFDCHTAALEVNAITSDRLREP